MDTFNPNTTAEHLAVMIAETFQDTENLNAYLVYCNKYPLEIIDRAFADARAVPDAQVKKSRAAIFFYLAKRYAHRHDDNLGR